jgi:hypothetical protein
MAVPCALAGFRQNALIESGWTCEGGASITTYFMGACLYDFPNEFRRYWASEQLHRQALRRQQEVYVRCGKGSPCSMSRGFFVCGA